MSGDVGSLLSQSESLLFPRRGINRLRLSACCCLKMKGEIDGVEFPCPWRNEN